MASHSHYIAQQAAVDAVEPPARPARPVARGGRQTVGNFTGTWKAHATRQVFAHLVNAAGETRCTTGPQRALWTRPLRSTPRCTYCANPAYCPDCGDTTNAPHGANCLYGGQR